MTARQAAQPSFARATIIVAAVTLGWSYVRTFLFDDSLAPLTYVLPMLVCMWTRRSWQLWLMAAVFVATVVVKLQWLADVVLPADQRRPYYGSVLFNIVAGAVIIEWMIRLRVKLDDRQCKLERQNVELELQAEELAQQNSEIKTQAEELAQQNEEIESQAEELGGQNEELLSANERLAAREDILQSLLAMTRSPETGLEALADACRRSLPALGKPADCVAILRIDADALRLKAQAAAANGLALPLEWPLTGTIAELVIREDKTAYVSDLAKQPEVAAPFGGEAQVRSILATPLRVAGSTYGVVLACSCHVSHWTQEQFHLIEWIAGQCGLIAESIRWQKEAADRSRAMEAANRAKDQFLAMLSHELRTPLTPVLAAAGVLEQDERLPAEVRADLAMIRRNVGIQSRLIDDLLDLTRLGRGKLELDSRALDLPALLTETTAIVAGDMDAKDQVLEIDLRAIDGCQVFGDGPRLQQVFWNLLKNANKYSPAKSPVVLSGRLVPGTPGRAVIEVRDAGIGIDPDNIHRIFLPFEQVLEDGKRRGGDSGLGLGLAIAKAIVELHGGRIDVASAGIGKGSTFSVELPVTKSEAATHPEPTLTRSPFGGAVPTESGRKILLVEDHGDTGRVLARVLRNSGHTVSHAETARGGMELFADGDFDLIISDLGLPDESGLELMKKLSALRPGIPGICLSGYGMEDDVKSCREAGFTEHLTKPVDLQRLRAAIARVAAERVR